jgi:hypothetical protein
VVPREARAKGYRKADFEDAWKRYLATQKEADPSPPDNFPFTRSPPWNDYAFAEKSPVHADDSERQKNGYLSNNINAVNAWTGKNPDTAPSSQIDDYPEFPECLWRTPIREVPPDGRPALGPPGDSVDDLQ